MSGERIIGEGYEPGWYIVDQAHDYAILRGPYKHSETAAAVRHEMENSWDDGDEFHPRPDTRNLWIVPNEVEEPATALNRESAVSELLAALRPFADVAGVVNTTVPDECCVDILMSKHLPTVGDCRRAAEAVQKWESGT